MLQAYQQIQKNTGSPRSVEYRLFAQVTRALIEAREMKPYERKFVDAVHWNRQVWNALSNDLSQEANGLPAALRANLISIALWVGKYSSQTMRGDADISALIDVNRNIMEGLAARQAAEPAG
ncbi:flagellar biosynthesis regulator FlaF [Oceanibacterium hippocampi]|uniref:Flagellar biosynthesis regulatory protein FlaF n=1 Tax=Oceanibacterium hippocampi TaxID=745714 RepID=A0A1Y5TZ49_9PROT|nr:flagellar biosynthesis regulator FlaF [Oceanibacterium hippocampi]SLN77151.1 flagellar biosynthesis regulatory protein FlaF [Oceanibacterium hippocampi]